jgi:hypothetical protein
MYSWLYLASSTGYGACSYVYIDSSNWFRLIVASVAIHFFFLVLEPIHMISSHLFYGCVATASAIGCIWFYFVHHFFSFLIIN